MIINSEEQIAAEMARRMRTKVTKQGLVDNDAHYSSVYNAVNKEISECSFSFDLLKKEQNLMGGETEQSMKKNIEISSTVDKSTNQTRKCSHSFHQSIFYAFIYLENLHLSSSTKKIYSSEQSKAPIVEESNPLISLVDSDNDYIEPESPTGVDALIYDEEDDDDDSNNLNTFSQPSTVHSPMENIEDTPPYQPIIRDDYNPAKAKNEATSM